MRDPARWIVDTLRDGRDLSEVLSARRDSERSWQRWERQQAALDQVDVAYRQQQELSARWAAAISDALDDDQLTRALEGMATLVAGLGRSSVPVARAQLLGWAVAVHNRHPGRSLRWALAADLKAGPSAPDPLQGGLPEPPAAAQRDDDLPARIAGVLARRPDLTRVGGHSPEPPQSSPHRLLERSLER